MKKFLEEFKSFALRGNVMDMAVGVLIGGAFSGIVTSLTDNFIQPIIKLVMTGKVYTLEEISGYASAFGSSVVNFLIMAFILFCLLKAMNKVMSFGSKPEEPAQPTTKICPFCMSEIDIRATRCPHCTSVQPESEADRNRKEYKMKVTIIHGQSHKGSTYHISKILADKIGGEVKEFFLPRDFGEFCIGCTQCFRKSETLCPHYEKINPLTEALDEADVLIFESPVYVYHVTGSMKAFLDHYGYRWMLHRPEESMFHKQAVCISTAAGAGMKSTNKDMADSFFYWGVPKVYKYGVRVMATSYKDIKPKIKAKIEKDTNKMAYQIKKNAGHVKTGIKTKICFYFMRMLHTRGWDEADLAYWSKKGWDREKRPWKNNKGV